MSPRSSKKKSKAKKKTKKGGASAPADVYVSLLYVSVAATTVGIIFLVMELSKYDWSTAT